MRRRSRSGLSSVRYGSGCSPTAARSSALASCMDSSTCSRSMSRRCRSAAIQRASSSTWRLTSAVTFGLPSRSPPIQEAKRTGTASSGRRWPQWASRASSRSRNMSGTARHRECSMTAKPHLASSSGVGRWRRISSVCQASAIRRRRRSRLAARSRSVRSSWSLAASSAAMASYFWIRLRRATSVGWAVSTSSISSPASRVASSAGSAPPASRRGSSSSSTRFSKGSGSPGAWRRT